MSEFLTYTIVGLVTAAIYAIAASGLVVTYTTSGVFNIAHGAVGMFGAFVFWQLRWGWNWPAPLALVVVIGVLAPLFGCGVEKLLMRNLADASEATKLAVTIGLLIAMEGAALWIWNPQTARPFPPFYVNNKVSFFGTYVTWTQLITLGTFILCVLVLWFILYRTRIGIDMRAVVDNRPLLMLVGGNPNRASRLSWILGSSLAAIAGILIAPTLQLSVAPLTLLVINAYAAAIIGRLRSLPFTFLGAAIIGLAGSYVVGYLPVSTVNWLQNLPLAIPIIILLIALLLQPHERLRGYIVRRSRESFPVPSYRLSLTGAAILIAVCAALAPVLSTQPLYFASVGLALGVIGLSLVPLLGYAGQISLCQMTFAGVGALAFAHATGGGSLLGLLVAFGIAALIGLIAAVPAIRLRGLYLALATAAIAELFDSWIFGLPSVTWFGHTLPLFESGAVPIARLSIPGISLTSNRTYLVALGVIFSIFGLVVVAIRRSRFGRALLAMRESQAGSETLGMRTTALKLGVFTLSAGIAGVGGVLLAGVYTQVTPTQFSFLTSLPLLLLIMAGGAGTVGGATFGALALGVFGYIGTISTFIYQISQLLPGLVGVGLGKQPNGVAADISASLGKLAARLPGNPAERLRLASATAPVRVSGPVAPSAAVTPSGADTPSGAVSPSEPGPESPSGSAVPDATVPDAGITDAGITDAGITVEGRS
jgi:branched-chain amino acid transport system permease protein